MTRWLIVPVLCALAMPSTASAQAPASPPAAEPTTTAAPVAAAAPAAGSKAARAAEATAAAVEAETPEASPTGDAPLSAAPADTAPPAVPASAPVPPPPPPVIITTPPPPSGPQRDKRAEPLLIAGLSGFAGVYLLTAYAGAATIDKARELSRGDSYDPYGNPDPGRDGKMTRNRGRALLIPVAGPFIAMHFTNSARRKYWQAVNGSLQAGSLAMAIIGSRMYAKHRRAKRRAQVTASASPEGAQVGMSMRF